MAWRKPELRLNQLREKVPELFNEPRTVLYVGAMKKQHQCVEELKEAGCTITLLELVEGNCEYYEGKGIFDHIICGDVREVDQHFTPDSFDVVLWWHGPEHVDRKDVEPSVAKLEKIATKLVVLASPWGKTRKWTYSIIGREHLSALYVDDYLNMGFNVATLGEADRWRKGTQLLAWKWL